MSNHVFFPLLFSAGFFIFYLHDLLPFPCHFGEGVSFLGLFFGGHEGERCFVRVCWVQDEKDKYLRRCRVRGVPAGAAALPGPGRAAVLFPPASP